MIANRSPDYLATIASATIVPLEAPTAAPAVVVGDTSFAGAVKACEADLAEYEV